MICAGIWTADGQILRTIEAGALALPHGVLPIHGTHPDIFMGTPLDALIVAPDAEGWADARGLVCRMLLVPDSAGERAGGIRAGSAVSYGTCPRDTLTLSSLEGAQICLALQRELVTVSGAVIGQQEFILPYPAGWSPDRFLCAVGALLLLGVPIEGSGLPPS